MEIEGVFEADTDTVSLDNVQLLAPCPDQAPELSVWLETNPAWAVLSWPASALCYRLEAAETLGSPEWTRNLTVVRSEVVDGWRRVTIDLTPGTRFFRLARP